MENTIIIYTDGSCKGNPGIGGWAAILSYKQHTKEIFGFSEHTTNNKMELAAVIYALLAVKKQHNIIIRTDSMYVKNGITKWIQTWQKNQWKTSDKKPVKNIELWKKMLELSESFNIEWQWVKGHADDVMNERADELANFAIKTRTNTNTEIPWKD